ncbi:MAG: hypothetical protein AAFU41_06895 [Pseudomonadota bacterium]
MKLCTSTLSIALLPLALLANPLFPNSVESNDLDFILPHDPGACWSIDYNGVERTEMYDPRRNSLFVDDALRFLISFPDQQMRINVHPAVGDPEMRASQIAASISRLPAQMRNGVAYVNILDGNGSAWEESAGGFFTVYDQLMERRLAEHDLDETVFHEAAHLFLEPVIGRDPDWSSNQRADGAFITEYAAENPTKEDLAESALFAWTMLHHPGRLPPHVESAVRDIMPNRLDYLGNILADLVRPSCY